MRVILQSRSPTFTIVQMNGRIRLVIVLSTILFAVPGVAAQPILTVQSGLSSGVLLAPNPGAFYGTPVVTELAAEIVVPTAVPLTAGVWLGFAPFLPIEESFGRSLLTLLEVGAGARVQLMRLDGGGFYADGMIGGGFYTRVTEGERAAGTARRPTALLRTGIGMTAGSWEYQLTVVTRVLFDRQPVVALAPQLGFRYRFPVGDTK